MFTEGSNDFEYYSVLIKQTVIPGSFENNNKRAISFVKSCPSTGQTIVQYSVPSVTDLRTQIMSSSYSIKFSKIALFWWFLLLCISIVVLIILQRKINIWHVNNFIETDIQEADIDVSANLQSDKTKTDIPKDIEIDAKTKAVIPDATSKELFEETKEYSTGVIETGELQTSRQMIS